MNIVDLPTDVILPVLLYLPQEDIIRNVRLVCTNWYQLCEEACFWKHLRIRTAEWGNRHTSPSFREFVERVSDRVEELDIIARKDDKGQHVEEKHLDIADIRFPKLRSIVCNTTFSSNFFTTFITHNSHVQYVDFQFGGKFDYILGMQKIASLKDKEFKGLFIYYNDLFPLADILRNTGHSLEKLIFFKCNIGLDKIFNTRRLSRHPAFKDLGSSLNSLVNVSILDGDMDDSGLEFLSTWAPRLKELNIHVDECELKVSDIGISRLASNCPDLEIITITALYGYGPAITDVGLTNIARCCRLLRVLKLSVPIECSIFNGITDAGITAVAHSCPLLRELHAENCPSLTDGAVRSLADSCPQLKVLNLSKCMGLTSQSVTDAVTRSPGLVKLKLNKCVSIENIILDGDEDRGKHSRGEDVHRNVSDVDIETLETEMAALHADSELIIAGTDHCKEVQLHVNISEISVEETSMPKEGNSDTVSKTYSSRLGLLENHYHLWGLDLNGCHKLSDGCLIQISRHCPDMRELRIDGCSRVTDTGVSELVKRCEFLTILSFSMASRSSMCDHEGTDEGMLTDIAMFDIARHCKYLQDLDVTKHHNITTDGIAAVAGGCPNIESITMLTDIRSKVSAGQLMEALSKVPTRSKIIRLRCFMKCDWLHDIIYKLGVGEMETTDIDLAT